MKLKKLLGAMFLAMSLGAQADITDGHFSTAQIFDVQYNWSGTTLNASNFIAPYDMNFSHPTVGTGQYFAFFSSTTNPGTYGLGLYNSDGTLAQVVHNTGTLSAIGPSAIFYVGSGFFGTVITTSAGYSYGSSASFTNMDRSVSSTDASTYTWASTTPLAAGQTAGSTLTVVSTAAGTPIVTSSTSTSSTTTANVTTYGTATTQVTNVNSRGAETAKTLTVTKTTTTTVTTPVTVTTTQTTPVTTTTVTTPTTVTTYSDGTTTTSNGTPVTTSSTTNTVVTNVTNSNQVISSAVAQDYTTRVDAVARLDIHNGMLNQAATGTVMDRHTTNGERIVQRIGTHGDEKQGWMYFIADGTVNATSVDYKNKATSVGIGFERLVRNDILVGINYSVTSGSLVGPEAGGSYLKRIGTIYGLYTKNGWLLNTTSGYSNSSQDSYHTLNDLNLQNAGQAKGHDYWLHNRLYTPEFNGFRVLVGTRYEHNYRDAIVETGDAVSAMSYDIVNKTHSNTEYGIRWDKQFGIMVVGVEAAKNSDRLQSSSIMIGFTPRSNIVGGIGIKNQRLDNIENNIVIGNINWRF